MKGGRPGALTDVHNFPHSLRSVVEPAAKRAASRSAYASGVRGEPHLHGCSQPMPLGTAKVEAGIGAVDHAA